MFFVNIYRQVRSKVATAVLRWRCVNCGHHTGAARIPHIAGFATIEVGNHCGFNGITIAGRGG